MIPQTPISTQELEEITGGDREFLRLLTEQFWIDLDERLPQLRDSVANFDGPRLALLAHTIAGSAGCIAAFGLRERAKQLEQCGKERHAAGASQLLESLEAEICSVRKFLEEHISA